MPRHNRGDNPAAIRALPGEGQMSKTLSMLDLARELAQLASETRDPDTATRLIALTNAVLAASGHLPQTNNDGPSGGNGGTRQP